MIIPDSGATFSPSRIYRYSLWRRWKPGPTLHMTLLNPSTADEVKNDPTIERQGRRASAMGYGALIITNAYALRSTDPKALYGPLDPVGEDNDRHILAGALDADLTIVGWGAHCDKVQRGRSWLILEMFRSQGIEPHALRRNSDGSPAHPLYLPYGLTPEPMTW